MLRVLLVVLSSLVLMSHSAQAQVPQIPTNIDFSTVNVDNISDQQLMQLLQKAQTAGFSVDDILQQAQAKGMSSDNLAKLKDRLTTLNTTPSQYDQNNPKDQGVSRKYNAPHLSLKDSLEQVQRQNYRSRIFGSDLFNNTNLSFEPDLTIPTPAGYILGAGDQLIIDVYGYSEKSDKLSVTPDGYVNIPDVGPVLVSGMTMDEARATITNRLSAIYSGIKSGKTHVQVLLGDIRSIKVIVTGEIVHPGSYTLPSLATVVNALYVSGGPGENGSFRNITLIRDGAVIDTFDLYRFLKTGSLAGNVLLRDQDIVKVNPYNKRVILAGQVKHPAIFEARDDETLQDMIDYAGGYTDRAYTGVLKATRVTDKEKEVLTIPQAQVKGYALESGDSLFVDSVLNRYINKINITGPVFFPGNYALRPGMTVNDVIKAADGLKEDIFMNRGLIKRRRPDFTPEIISFSVGDVLSGTTAVPVQAEDSIILYSKTSIRQPAFIYIGGEVNKPDSLPFLEGMHLEDAILMAGGFKDAASFKEVEIARRARSQEYDPKDLSIAVIIKMTVPGDYEGHNDTSAFILQPFDKISIRRAPGYKEQGVVRLQGQVVYPGEFVISSRSEKLSDLVARAGGLKTNAYPEGAQLLRKKNNDESEQYFERNKEEVFKEANKGDDSAEITRIRNTKDIEYQLVDINLEKALRLPGSKYDILLQSNDIIRVPERLETVSLNGEIFYPKQVRYDAGYRFKDFIYQAGGFTSQALKRGSYVVYPNGEVSSTRKIFFINHYPRVKPGSDIYVPAKRKREAASTAEILGLTTGVAALLGIVISIIEITK